MDWSVTEKKINANSFLFISISLSLKFDHMMAQSIALIYDTFKYNTDLDW